MESLLLYSILSGCPMVITSLVVENFGLFHGVHRLTCSPNQIRRVCLIVAKNGLGKTTLFNALHIGLFGRLPRGTYVENLSGLINMTGLH